MKKNVSGGAKKGLRKAGGFFNDFKEFAVRGNVLDLAVGVIIGGAFGKITTSLVSDIIMPLVGLLVGGFNFAAWKYTLPNLWNSTDPVTLNVGLFVQSLVDFVLIAFFIYLFVRLATRLREKPTAKEESDLPAREPEPETPEDILLLREIRDLLKK